MSTQIQRQQQKTKKTTISKMVCLRSLTTTDKSTKLYKKTRQKKESKALNCGHVKKQTNKQTTTPIVSFNAIQMQDTHKKKTCNGINKHQ